jgi:hypothetical protein
MARKTRASAGSLSAASARLETRSHRSSGSGFQAGRSSRIRGTPVALCGVHGVAADPVRERVGGIDEDAHTFLIQVLRQAFRAAEPADPGGTPGSGRSETAPAKDAVSLTSGNLPASSRASSLASWVPARSRMWSAFVKAAFPEDIAGAVGDQDLDRDRGVLQDRPHGCFGLSGQRSGSGRSRGERPVEHLLGGVGASRAASTSADGAPARQAGPAET